MMSPLSTPLRLVVKRGLPGDGLETSTGFPYHSLDGSVKRGFPGDGVAAGEDYVKHR